MITMEDFKDYVLKWAKTIHVDHKISSIQIRKMKNKIASCSVKGRITFDTAVLDLPIEEMDKIILHELLHLRYKNHGKLFKMVLNHYLKIKNTNRDTDIQNK